jgi:hypothetical protein
MHTCLQLPMQALGVPLVDGGVIEANANATGASASVQGFNATQNVLLVKP